MKFPVASYDVHTDHTLRLVADRQLELRASAERARGRPPWSVPLPTVHALILGIAVLVGGISAAHP